MFAVPGWSLSANRLKQDVDVTPSKSAEKKSRKRKRGNANPGVTDDNVADLWQQQYNPTPAGPDVTESETAQSATENQSGGSNKSKKDKKPKNKDLVQDRAKGDNVSRSATQSAQSTTSRPAPAPATAQLTPLQSAMRQKLVSARFRHLNQTLYTAPSSSSLELFAANPDMFDDYHSGFRQQVSVWPENPVDVFIQTLRRRARVKPLKSLRHSNRRPSKTAATTGTGAYEPLMRTRGTCTIADLGCGDARMAQVLTSDGTAAKHNLHILSYDLQSNSPLVTKCDVASLPLADGSVDIAIFCLALMGTNWIDFIEEAYRVLHWKGELWIAEIKSRFGRGLHDGKKAVVGHSIGSKRKAVAKQKSMDLERVKRTEREDQEMLKTEVDGEEKRDDSTTNVAAFLAVLARRGFELRKGQESVDLGNKMFVRLELVKSAKPTVGKNVEQQAVDKEDDGRDAKRKKPLKFLDGPAVKPEEEAGVLKPCLYKIR